MEIDEPLAPEKAVKLLLARGIPAHEALEGTGFVCREMIDMQVGILRPTRHDEIDELLERGLLTSGIERPPAEGCWLVGRRGRPAEQIFEPADTDERVALDIEEDVAR